MEDYIVSFYNENKEKRKYSINKYFLFGECGYIYRLDDNTCLKLFSENLFLNPKVMPLIKKLNLDNFYKIYDILFDDNNHYCGYTMKYYQHEEINILTMPTYYTLDNLHRLDKSFQILTNNNLYAFDTYEDNVIMDAKDITLIDTDLYYFYGPEEREVLSTDNKKVLMELFRKLYYLQLILLGYPTEDIDYFLAELFDENEPISNTEKKLVRYKYPIDYFKKNIGGINE